MIVQLRRLIIYLTTSDTTAAAEFKWVDCSNTFNHFLKQSRKPTWTLFVYLHSLEGREYPPIYLRNRTLLCSWQRCLEVRI